MRNGPQGVHTNPILTCKVDAIKLVPRIWQIDNSAVSRNGRVDAGAVRRMFPCTCRASVHRFKSIRTWPVVGPSPRLRRLSGIGRCGFSIRVGIFRRVRNSSPRNPSLSNSTPVRRKSGGLIPKSIGMSIDQSAELKPRETLHEHVLNNRADVSPMIHRGTYGFRWHDDLASCKHGNDGASKSLHIDRGHTFKRIHKGMHTHSLVVLHVPHCFKEPWLGKGVMDPPHHAAVI
jgi:hypothetical protein